MYETIVNGKSVLKFEQTRPREYENVKVWASRGDYYPAARARIKNLKVTSKGILLGSFAVFI